MSQRSSHTHTTAPQGNRTDQSCGKSVPAQRKKNYFLKFSPLLKIFKPAIPQPTQTAKTLTDNGLTMTEDRRPTGNSTYPKVARQCEYEHLSFKQTLVHIHSLVFQIATFG